MADISLTASMRSNLLSLQNTQSLMDTTQERLSTGKKVNSAIDNPSSYYTAQSLNNRASDLSSLLDSMGQGIQTIKAADEAIKAITSFAEQAKAIANSARDSASSKTATTSGTLADSTTDTMSFTYDGKTYTTAAIAVTAADGLDAAATKIADALTAAKDGAAVPAGSGVTFTAEVVDGQIKIGTSDGKAVEFVDGTAAGLTVSGEIGNIDRASSMQQYNDILSQIDQLAKDAGYKGVNLLQENDLKVVFNEDRSSFLDIKGVKADSTGLGLTTAAGWEENAAIDAAVTAVDGAINKLRNMASEFGNNYSVVQNREDFTENLVNVLTEGADKLTLADMNEESANMLALQTRQQLAINSLSLASQAAQSVLKLF